MSNPIFVLNVALAGQKGIWRKIAVRGNQTLDDLHRAIFDAFDRYDEHLYSFYFPPPGAKKLTRAKMQASVEYTCSAEGPFSDSGPSETAETTFGRLHLQPKQVFFYLFDFGDEWWHEITVESVDAPAQKGKYPRVLESRGESPPQYPDCDDEDDDEYDDE